MYSCECQCAHDRRGIAALLFCIMLPLFIAFVALSVDLGVVAIADGQLRCAADAAALAGAMTLVDDYRLQGISNISTEVTAANAAAAVAQANLVLGSAPVIVANTSNTTSGDVVVGYLDPNNINATLNTSTATESTWNAVQVTTSRSSDHGGIVPGFFSRLMGFTGSTVSTTSTAIAQNYTITGVRSDGAGTNANLLPIVLDQTTYNAMMAGTTPRIQYTWNPATKTVSRRSRRRYRVGALSGRQWFAWELGDGQHRSHEQRHVLDRFPD